MVKSPAANTGDLRDAGLILGSGRSPGVGHGKPLQYSGLKNPMDREALWATVHRVSTESDMTEMTEHECTSFIIAQKIDQNICKTYIFKATKHC